MHINILTVLLFASILSNGSATIAKSTQYPGRCETNEDCIPYGKNLVCIAVDTNIAGLERLNMCIPGDSPCSGQNAGMCPTFSSWPSKYRKIQSVCAFQTVPNCNKKFGVNIGKSNTASSSSIEIDDDVGDEDEETITIKAASESGSQTNNTVECYVRNFTSQGKTIVVQGIYSCVDVKIYKSINGGHLTTLTDSHIQSCAGNNASITTKNFKLCNGQGTCAPKQSFSEEYECKCNAGYSNEELCKTFSSNECSNFGQCGTGGTCNIANGQTIGTCTCKDGAQGNQCSQCDATAGDSVCSKNGICNATTSECTCDAGYSGALCEDYTGVTGNSSEQLNINMATLIFAILFIGFEMA